MGHKVKWRRRAAARTVRRASLVQFYESLAVSVIKLVQRLKRPACRQNKSICIFNELNSEELLEISLFERHLYIYTIRE